MSTVSIIIPNYNRADIIAETINNMLSQTCPPLEIIVVDDGSSDHSIEIIKGFGDKVKLLVQANKGPGAARNAGLALAKGTYVQFMDSDDLASLNKLEVQAAMLDKTAADIVYGPWVKAWLSNNQVKLMDVVLQQKELPAGRSPLEWFLTDWSMVFQQCLVRRSLLEQVGGYREDMRLFEDGDLFVRLLLAGGRLVYESESLTFYRLEDYGKLTASGEARDRKALDQAKFYTIILEFADIHTDIRAIVRQAAFARNAYNALNDLYQSNNFDQNLHAKLHQFVGKTNHLAKWGLLWQSKRAGMQQRIKGHRWPGCYAASNLNTHQKRLINNLERQLN